MKNKMVKFTHIKKTVPIALLLFLLAVNVQSETIDEFIPSEKTISNGSVVSYKDVCYQAKNNPTARNTPGRSSRFWDIVTCDHVSAVTMSPAPPCRPAGLYTTPGVNHNYCSVYDSDGREKMGSDHPRRIIGYFTSWRNGADGQPPFLASDVPWDRVTHINYAFAGVDGNGEISIGDVTDPANAATGMTWIGAANVPNSSLPYKGHFNLLNRYAHKHGVKLLISVGGWAESGAFFNVTVNQATGEINHVAISKFADSAVRFIDTYDFDGLDIDYEYPSSMPDSGNPLDWKNSNKHRGKLWAGYMALMKTLREALDKHGEKNNRHYLLTIAAPASSYLLRGSEGFQALQYIDFVNIMSYDFHGTWNHFVGHNAPLYDNGKDSELADAGIYSGEYARFYDGQGSLNIDWAYKYFRNTLPGGRINIGLPYYSRGFQGVKGGTNGLNGTAALPDQTKCSLGTGDNLGPHALGEKGGNPCGYGAQGIDNLWFDTDTEGNEMFAGHSPLWHTNNLRDHLPTPYLESYYHDVNKESSRFTGTYLEFFDDEAKAAWLWNKEKNVFISADNLHSYQAKVQYAIDQGAGGIMLWEMAGDYSTPSQNGLGYHYFGSTMTDAAYRMISNAPPYGIKAGDENFAVAEQTVDVVVDLVGFSPRGDENYPIQIALKLTNNSNVDLSGAKISFNVTSAVPMNAEISDTLTPDSDPSGPAITNLLDLQSGAAWFVDKIAQSGLQIGNRGGLSDDFHRFSVQLKVGNSGTSEWKAGQTIDIPIRIYMPMPVPTNFIFQVDGKTYGRTSEL
jgi:GH18 family chitinase